MTGSRLSLGSTAPTGVVGKVFTSLFFLIFLGFGLFFVGLIARDVFAGLRLWTWQQTNCDIIASSVEETEKAGRHVGQFEFVVQYRYSFGGQTFTSDQYKRDPKAFSDYSKAARLTERYRPGSTAVCYVNPAAPAQAVLERDNLLFGLTIFFPMIFVAIGAGSIYYTWRPKAAAQENAQPISDRARLTKGQRAVSGFFLIFLLMGSGFLYGFVLRPAFKMLVARDWPAVPCVVLASEVETHSGDDGSTYSVNILYRYEFNGREFKANRYHFLGGSSSGYSGKQAIVRRHPPGTKTLCYVNPSDPTEAVLERGFTPDLWFGLIPLAFVIIGAGGFIITVRKGRQPSLIPAAKGQSIAFGRSPSSVVSGRSAGGAAEPLVLKPKVPPWLKLLGIIGIALFWNGIVSVFVTQVVKSWRSGHPEWFLTLFMIPFVLVGLVLIGSIGYQALALFNPRPRLKVTPGAIPLGGTLRIEWEIAGRTEMMQHLRVHLVGREEATYRRGTNT
ncbi:MAG TPA: DUF3592 domain-containing protein, partial [Candidatus Sulfotelmatobacter sp.]|nr:DUF3592 domain-containing protein [Candidatus Sulfotelmatobacter sp.]